MPEGGRTFRVLFGMPDPAAVVGTEEEMRWPFDDTVLTIKRRLDLFLALPMHKLSRLALESGLKDIGTTGTVGSVREVP